LVARGAGGDPGVARVRQIAAAVAVAIVVALAILWFSAYSEQQRLLADAQMHFADAALARAERAFDLLRKPIEASPVYRSVGALAFDRSAKLLAAQDDLYG